jgi:uncharacterized protein (TIGR02452 family)
MKADLVEKRKLAVERVADHEITFQKDGPPLGIKPNGRAWATWCFRPGNPGKPPQSMVEWNSELKDTSVVYPSEGSGFQGTLHFDEGDMITFAAKLAGIGKSVCILNMANRTSPGGGFITGCRAQEEQLCHRSDLFPRLKLLRMDKRYPIHPGTAFLTPDVYLKLQGQEKSFAPLPGLPNQYPVSVISAAANRYRDEADAIKDDTFEVVVDANWRAILTAAGKSGAEVAVLSAIGCGAFNNPTDLVAASLAKVMREPLDFGSLTRVCVVLMEDHNSGGTNVARFRTRLEAAAIRDDRFMPTAADMDAGSSSASVSASSPDASSNPPAKRAKTED